VFGDLRSHTTGLRRVFAARADGVRKADLLVAILTRPGLECCCLVGRDQSAFLQRDAKGIVLSPRHGCRQRLLVRPHGGFGGGGVPDLKVFIEPTDASMLSAVAGEPRFVPSSQIEHYRQQIELAKTEARQAKEQAQQLIDM
jgi:hypothetical protein